jgi:hypothetical protein
MRKLLKIGILYLFVQTVFSEIAFSQPQDSLIKSLSGHYLEYENGIIALEVEKKPEIGSNIFYCKMYYPNQSVLGYGYFKTSMDNGHFKYSSNIVMLNRWVILKPNGFLLEEFQMDSLMKKESFKFEFNQTAYLYNFILNTLKSGIVPIYDSTKAFNLKNQFSSTFNSINFKTLVDEFNRGILCITKNDTSSFLSIVSDNGLDHFTPLAPRIFVLNEKHIFCYGFNGTYNHQLLILETQNGGISWQKIDFPNSRINKKITIPKSFKKSYTNLYFPDFSDVQIHYTKRKQKINISNHYFEMHSKNGGESWSKIRRVRH